MEHKQKNEADGVAYEAAGDLVLVHDGAKIHREAVAQAMARGMDTYPKKGAKAK